MIVLYVYNTLKLVIIDRNMHRDKEKLSWYSDVLVPMLGNGPQMGSFSTQKLLNGRKSQKNTIWSKSDEWLDVLTSLGQKDFKIIENHFLLFYGIWGSKVLNFLVTLIISPYNNKEHDVQNQGSHKS